MASAAEVAKWRLRMRAGIVFFVGLVVLSIALGASQYEGPVGWIVALGMLSFVATFYSAWKYEQAFIGNAVANGMTKEEAQARWNEMYPNTD